MSARNVANKINAQKLQNNCSRADCRLHRDGWMGIKYNDCLAIASQKTCQGRQVVRRGREQKGAFTSRR